MNSRVKNVYRKLERKNLDGLIVSSPSNISYLTEYPSRDSYFLVSRKKNIYFTDSRYTEEAKRNLKDKAVVHKVNGSVFNLMAQACLGLGLKRIGFEGRHLPFAEYKKIKEGLKEEGLISVYGIIEEDRQIKDTEELEKIKKAVQITGAALKFISSFISPGKKEIEVVGELERFIRQQGALNSAFDIIVASGPNSSFPHHIPSQKKIKQGEVVLVDIGVEYSGYKSDLTRVFFLDKITSLGKKIYSIVLEAQKRAIELIRPAQIIGKIDACARNYIAHNGFGRFFGHSLGHGIGLEAHEEPHITGRETDVLMPGMVFTVEPAIYLPNRFGIRIEDMVLVTQQGCEVLSGVINK